MKKIYSRFRNLLNDKQKGNLSKLAFLLSKKPTIKKDSIDPTKKFPNGEKGGLIISADFEMAWAWRYTKTGENYLHKGKIERENFPEIIRILEKYHIPITFAIVGHLFLEQCNNGDHDWMRRIPHFNDHWKFTEGDWYDHDPHSNYKEAPEWYAPDLIDQILKAKTNHEIGCHTFSHIDCRDHICSPEVFKAEMKACQKVAKPKGIELESFVHPAHTIGKLSP